MKIGIITHHDVHNHGAQLQLYGLGKVLVGLGHTVEVLTYRKNYDFLAEGLGRKYDISLASIPFYTKYLLEQGVRKTIFNIKKRWILHAFQNRNSMIGEYYSRAKGLDCAFVGSDEVFSIESGLNNVFWGFGVPCKKVFAYAGSFGPTTLGCIQERYAEGYVRAGIERFEKISVRDKNSQSIIEKLSGKRPPIVCDPVILYGYDAEKEMFKKPLKERYLVVYAYDNNMNDENEVQAITSYAKSQGLLTVSVGFYHQWCDMSVNVSPIELLEFIWAADCVVTDTFHGSVISILMNRPFVARIRGNENKLGFLMDEYGLSDRVSSDLGDLATQLDRPIEYARVNHLMEAKRRQSMDYLESCLEKVADD